MKLRFLDALIRVRKGWCSILFSIPHLSFVGYIVSQSKKFDLLSEHIRKSPHFNIITKVLSIEWSMLQINLFILKLP